MTNDQRWLAVLERKAAADGHFLYAVKTTGIYCRPTCPSKRPKRENVTFYLSSEEAEEDGYRACRRCRPNSVSRQQQMVAHVQRMLETIEPEPSLKELSEAVGLSQFHLQRAFKRATGMSPKQYAIARREVRLKHGLVEGKRVASAMYDAGYGSSQALYGSASSGLGMQPKSYRKGGDRELIRFGLFDSPLGRMLIASTTKGIVALRFGDDQTLLGELHREFPRATLAEDPASLASYQESIAFYLNGTARKLDLPVSLNATEFQARVWQVLRQIPYGETRSYREVAEMIGQPGAARAVARACATNPVALVIPCHRVVLTSGGPSGYRWGRERKEALLAQERAGTD